MTDSEYALLANAVTSLDAAILTQMKRRAETKDKLRELLDLAELLNDRGNMLATVQLNSCLKELRKTIETL